jgi:hypothetical protein
VSVGSDATCVLSTGGAVQCWGYNTVGQLGNGSTTNSAVPVQVVGLTSGVTAVSMGGGINGVSNGATLGLGSACAIVAGGGVSCWGVALSYGPTSTSSIVNCGTSYTCYGKPFGVMEVASGATALSVGLAGNACALVGGGVKCWGTEGETGHIAGLSGVATAVSAGSNSVCALIAGGAVQCWGNNSLGQLGCVGADGATPAEVTGLTSGATTVSVGDRFACAITAAGGVVCWGSNKLYQLGNGGDSQDCGQGAACRPTPVQVTGLTSGVTALSAGVVCWGRIPGTPIPVAISGLGSGATSVSVGIASACALTTDGVQCWGNAYLGNGTMSGSNLPVHVNGF